jgi:hypothetical protein
MSQFATAVQLRTYIGTTKTTERYTTENLDFMLEAASNQLERATGRTITASASNTVKTFSTYGRAVITIPDLRVASTVSMVGSALTADETYHLIPSTQDQAIYTGIQVRPYRTSAANWWLAYPEWFDRNLDSPRFGAGYDRGLPNDLVITGLWGWSTVPTSWRLATMALAGYYLKHSDALLSGGGVTADELVLDFSEFPSEVRQLIKDWQLGEQAVLV